MPKRKRKRVYVPGEWKRRQRVDPRSKSAIVGRPREGLKHVDDRAVAALLRRWHHETMTRTASKILAVAAHELHAEWFDSLDDEIPAGVDLSAVLWGTVPRAMDGALPRYRDVPEARRAVTHSLSVDSA